MAIKRFSNQDGNIANSTLVTSRDKLYSDIDATFSNKPDGDVYKKLDGAAVTQSVKNLLLTNRGEKPFAYNYGGNLYSLLFENADFFTEKNIEEQITFAIQNYEPRAELLEVTAKSLIDLNDVSVRIVFRIVNTTDTITFETSLSRLR